MPLGFRLHRVFQESPTCNRIEFKWIKGICRIPPPCIEIIKPESNLSDHSLGLNFISEIESQLPWIGGVFFEPFYKWNFDKCIVEITTRGIVSAVTLDSEFLIFKTGEYFVYLSNLACESRCKCVTLTVPSVPLVPFPCMRVI